MKKISEYADTYGTEGAFCPACEMRLYHVKPEE
jgi:hypothetical protein